MNILSRIPLDSTGEQEHLDNDLKQMTETEKTKVIIIEDEFFAASHLKDVVESFGYEVVNIFDNGEEFIREDFWDFQIAIVDIFLSGELTGLDVAKEMKGKNRPFIFLTANKDSKTLKTAANLQPVGYISKPFNEIDVEASLEIASSMLIKPLAVRGPKGVELLNPNDILYVKSDGAYVEIVTREKSIIQRKYIKDLVSVLPDFFIRTHRSYIVNSNHIEQRNGTAVIVDGKSIPISKSYKETSK